MKTLTNIQVKAISGGSYGVLHEDGMAYNLSCPFISQPCLDKFLVCLELDYINESKFDNCIDKLEKECEGLHGVIKLYNCLDAHGL